MSESSSFLEQRNKAFNEEVYSRPRHKHEESFVTVDGAVGDEAFKATWGMTRDELQRKNEADVKALFNEGSESKKDEIGRVFERDENKLKEKALTSGNAKSMVDTGGVFEKQDKLDEQPRFSEKPNKRLDNIDWDAFYDESDTMDPKQPHLSRQPTKFEDLKIEYHDTKDTVAEVKGFDQNSLDNNSTKTIGIEPETLDRLKKEIDEKEKAHNNEIKHHDTIKGPSLPSMDFVK